eukprot:scaffold7961_cov73-Skeletonema_dohrnii-CCMP3373.AAC.2
MTPLFMGLCTAVSATEGHCEAEKIKEGRNCKGCYLFSSTLVAWRIKRGFAKSCRPRSEINKLKRKLIAEEKKQCNDLDHRSSIALSTNQTQMGSMSISALLPRLKSGDAQRAELASRGVHITLYAYSRCCVIVVPSVLQ